MQTSISAEEFARFQTQLLELRQEKYNAEANQSRAEGKIATLEAALAQQSGELAQLRSRLSRIQHVGDIETVINENHSLRQRLLNVESSFQLQSSTLRAECERLQAENIRLKGSSATTVDVSIETISSSAYFPLVSTASQTYKRGWATALTQTDITTNMVAEWSTKAKELVQLTEVLEAERKTSENLLREVSRREIDVERLEGECEALRSELSVAQRRSERVQRELQRQLASAVRAAKRDKPSGGGGNTPSLSSLVLVSGDQNLDGVSVDSFSLCGGYTKSTTGEDAGDTSETSSGSNNQQQASPAMFSENDLKVNSHFLLVLIVFCFRFPKPWQRVDPICMFKLPHFTFIGQFVCVL